MKINSLISFVGNNDAAKYPDSGAITTVFGVLKFDEAHLIWTVNPGKENTEYKEIAEYVKTVLKKGNKNLSVILHRFEIKNPADHNEIYPKLLDLCNSLPKSRNYTAAIASGTPAMQVCWILMAESGDFKLKLIRSNESRFGNDLITEIKLNTGLPAIRRLKKENRELRLKASANLKNVKLDLKKITVKIGDYNLILGNVEFCYYRYFLTRAYHEKDDIKVVNNIPSDEFIRLIDSYFAESFPNLEKRHNTSFLSNVSKINKKIDELLEEDTVYYKIMSSGTRGNKKYSIGLPADKIKIK